MRPGIPPRALFLCSKRYTPMLHFYDRAGFARALTLDLDPQLKQLLTKRITALGNLLDYTEIVILEPSEGDDDIVRKLGFSLLADPYDGHPFGDPAFEPVLWDHLIAHDVAWEMTISFGSGFAYIVIILRDECDPVLAAMCQEYADSKTSG